ncbi:MAG: hypothetical protein WD733_01530 [Bryobacterales bacterium]
MTRVQASGRGRRTPDVRAILQQSGNGANGSYASRLVRWLRDPWWPPAFLQRHFNWRLPIIIGVVCGVAVAYLSGGSNSIWVLLFSLNAVIYIGIPFSLALVAFWKSETDRGRLIACDLASSLLVLVFLIPGNIMGKIYVGRQIDKAKHAGQLVAGLIDTYAGESGRLPQSLEELAQVQPLPESPFRLQYRAAPEAGHYELKITDPTCLFDCYWMYLPASKEWSFVSR